jgi:hypothetical protein
MVVARRFCMIMVLAFWQGGFLFYSSAVVPIGQEELGHRRQGFITRKVTTYLNESGVIALVFLGAESLFSPSRSVWSNRLRWLSWLAMAGTLACLIILHTRMDQILDPEEHEILAHGTFNSLHRWYLWISTFQWGFGLVYTWLMVGAWQCNDTEKRRIAEAPA